MGYRLLLIWKYHIKTWWNEVYVHTATHTTMSFQVQKLRIIGSVSEQFCCSIGSPQECDVSPFLFMLNTSICHIIWNKGSILKYVDDLIVFIQLNRLETYHGPLVEEFVQWCFESFIYNKTHSTIWKKSQE